MLKHILLFILSVLTSCSCSNAQGARIFSIEYNGLSLMIGRTNVTESELTDAGLKRRYTKYYSAFEPVTRYENEDLVIDFCQSGFISWMEFNPKRVEFRNGQDVVDVDMKTVKKLLNISELAKNNIFTIGGMLVDGCEYEMVCVVKLDDEYQEIIRFGFGLYFKEDN